MEHRGNISPTIKPKELSIRPRSFVFSPITEEVTGSYSLTPRRKLCLDSDDSLQSPSAFGDSLPGNTRSPSPRDSVSSTASTLFRNLEHMRINSPTIGSFSSEGSGESSDGYFSEVFETGTEENSNSSIPDRLSSLFTKPFSGQPLSDVARNKSTPINSLGRSRSTSLRGCLKRPMCDSALLLGEKQSKRTPLGDIGNSLSSSPSKKNVKGTTLFRSQSVSVPHSENTLFPKSPGEGGIEMIGDHSKPYLLPLMTEPNNNVTDQKSVTPETVARLLNHDFEDLVKDYTIVDCRYPYEYEGGHIQGAVNIFQKDQLIERFFTSPSYEERRRIIIFHCEFSSKRGPEMSRFMRKLDREKNGMGFPKLYYPEVYLLHGGYKNFYGVHSHLCEPESYKTMLDDDHKADLKLFSQRSKSWNAGDRSSNRRHLGQRRHSMRYNK